MALSARYLDLSISPKVITETIEVEMRAQATPEKGEL